MIEREEFKGKNLFFPRGLKYFSGPKDGDGS